MKTVLFALFIFIHYALFSQLTEIKYFGSNPGNLRSYIHVPNNLTPNQTVPLVIALHGCTQDATEIANETGWNELADKHGFIVLYPEQKKVNNATACFNWFSKSDIRFNGESKSIQQMIEFVQNNYSIDSNHIFTYGLSAGAAMSTALLAQYPETFVSGAILAGGPYGIAFNAIQAYGMMKDGGKSISSAEEWAQPVKDLHMKVKTYPSIIIFHGENDKTVDPINATNLVQQWLGLHPEISQERLPYIQSQNNISIFSFVDSVTNEVIIKEYLVPGLGHELPVDPGSGKYQGGQTGKYSKDIDFFSTYYIAKDFGLIKEE